MNKVIIQKVLLGQIIIGCLFLGISVLHLVANTQLQARTLRDIHKLKPFPEQSEFQKTEMHQLKEIIKIRRKSSNAWTATGLFSVVIVSTGVFIYWNFSKMMKENAQ